MVSDAILQKGHKGQGEATDAAEHCLHWASLMGYELSPLSPQRSQERKKKNIFMMKPGKKKKKKTQTRLKIPTICTTIDSFLPHVVRFIVFGVLCLFVSSLLFSFLWYPSKMLMKFSERDEVSGIKKND